MNAALALVFLLMESDLGASGPPVGMPIGAFSDPAACTRAASNMNASMGDEFRRRAYWHCEQLEVAIKRPTSGTTPRWVAAGYAQ